MLASIPDAYPDGDMKGEALFRVALARLGKQELDAARTALDRIEPGPSERAWGAAGRAAYYRARVSQLAGEVADARARYAAMVADEPLAYYMLMAYARLRALDDAAARAALQAAVAREPPGSFLTPGAPRSCRRPRSIASRGCSRWARSTPPGARQSREASSPRASTPR